MVELTISLWQELRNIFMARATIVRHYGASCVFIARPGGGTICPFKTDHLYFHSTLIVESEICLECWNNYLPTCIFGLLEQLPSHLYIWLAGTTTLCLYGTRYVRYGTAPIVSLLQRDISISTVPVFLSPLRIE